MGKYQERRKSFHMIFINLENAYDRVPIDLIWWALDKKSILSGYIEIFKDMYEGAVTSVRTMCEETSVFLVTICLHQGSTSKPASIYIDYGRPNC